MSNHYSDWYTSILSVLAHSFWQCFHCTVLLNTVAHSLCTHTHACMHTQTCIYTHILTYMNTHTFTHDTYLHMHTHTHRVIHTCMHTHSHICIHTNTCIYTLKITHRHRHACTHKYAIVCTQMDTDRTHKLETEGKVLHGEMTKEINSTEKT